MAKTKASAAPPTHAERCALGLAERKKLARSAHASLDLNVCPADPMALMAASMKGRVESLIPLKYERMAASPFGFYRGAVPVMAADLACHPHTGLFTQLCGDAHVVNLGAFASPDGRTVFDINDFDETIHGPFEWDVKRLATSLLLAGEAAGIRGADRRAAVATFTARYRRSMNEFAHMPVIELARYQIHRLAHLGPMPAILRQAERSTPQRLLEKLTEFVPAEGKAAQKKAAPVAAKKGAAGKAEQKKATNTTDTPPPAPVAQARRFRETPPELQRLSGKLAADVLASLDAYRETLQPERQHFLAQYAPRDVAMKVVGTGSVGLRDYVIYMEGESRPAHSDPLFLQIKEEPASAYASYLPKSSVTRSHQGHRVMDGQRAMQLTSDPFLGYTNIEGRDYLVRQLNDHKAGLDLTMLTPASLHGYADVCGELLARGHARAGDPVSISTYLGTSGRFDDAILTFARAYAEKTGRDWELLKKWLKQNGAKAQAKA
ncbi:MAG TPA: DUF2252 domain-containing protein [Acidobacteriaceae bacterium]|jgi:uncharacterized protein (DUF2252 family)